MTTIKMPTQEEATQAVAEMIQKKGSVKAGQFLPVELDGQRAYLPSWDMYFAAIESLLEEKAIRYNRVAGIYVWKGRK